MTRKTKDFGGSNKSEEPPPPPDHPILRTHLSTLHMRSPSFRARNRPHFLFVHLATRTDARAVGVYAGQRRAWPVGLPNKPCSVCDCTRLAAFRTRVHHLVRHSSVLANTPFLPGNSQPTTGIVCTWSRFFPGAYVPGLYDVVVFLFEACSGKPRQNLCWKLQHHSQKIKHPIVEDGGNASR